MAALVKFNTLTFDVLSGVHNFSSHVFKLLLTNSAPSVSNSVKADLTEITAEHGYAAGGPAVTISLVLSVGTSKLTATDLSIVAAGGTIGPFRYAALYNDTSTGDRLIGYIDTGQSRTLADGDTHVFDFDGTNGIAQLA